MSFPERYGPWGLVVGASQGIGASSARLLASRGLDLVLVALPEDPLDDVVEAVGRAGRQCTTISGDVGDLATIDAISLACADRDVGIVVVNAALAAQGAVLELDEELLIAQVRVNCDAALRLVRRLVPAMVDRGRGGLVLTSSMSSLVAAPWIATYAATKAFLLRFGESLAEELRGTGVDVTVLVPGAVDTPRFRASLPRGGPRPVAPDVAAAAALDALGRRTVVVPGGPAVAAQRLVLQRILPRRVANGLMRATLRRMYR